MIRISPSYLIIGLFSISIASSSNEAKAVSKTVTSGAPAPWVSSSAERTKLDDFQPCGDYEIRPPKAFTARSNSSGSMHGYAWTSAPRPDGTQTYIMVVVGMPPADVLAKSKAADILTPFVRGVARRRTHFAATPPQIGTINGLTFARSYWHGTDSTTGEKMHGFVYAAVDGSSIIELSSQDLDASWTATQRLTEASAFTFRPHASKP